MVDVIQQVTTPLALAALIILIAGSIVLGIVRTKRTTNVQRRIIPWVFVSVIALSVLANISYLAQIFFFSEKLFLGTVVDDNGNPILFAFVDLQGVGRAATANDGSFQLSIPYSRQRSSYTVRASAPGFSAVEKELPGPEPLPQTIVLQELTADLEETLAMAGVVTLTQNLGSPFVITRVHLTNEIDRDFALDDFIMTVFPPAGDSITLSPVFMKPLLSNVTAPPARPLTVLRWMNEIPFEIDLIWGFNQNTVGAVLVEIAPDLPFHPSEFCTEQNTLPVTVAERLRLEFEEAFFWQSGDYNIRIEASVDGVRQSIERTFQISETQSVSLFSVSRHLDKCLGIATPIDFPQEETFLVSGEEGATNFVVLPMQLR